MKVVSNCFQLSPIVSNMCMHMYRHGSSSESDRWRYRHWSICAVLAKDVLCLMKVASFMQRYFVKYLIFESFVQSYSLLLEPDYLHKTVKSKIFIDWNHKGAKTLTIPPYTYVIAAFISLNIHPKQCPYKSQCCQWFWYHHFFSVW